jgi:hypothetical protein
MVNNSPQVNGNGVLLERMHITLQCWVVIVYSEHSLIQKSGSGFWLNSIFTEPLVAISMRLSCLDVSKWTGGRAWKGYRMELFVSSVSGKYLRNWAPCVSCVCCYITFDIVRKLEFICTQRNHTTMESVFSLLMQTAMSSNFLIIAYILSRTLNIVAESPSNPTFRSFGREKTSPR